MRAADLERIGAWLCEPHVARWYLAGSTVEQEVEELRQCVDGEQPTHALVVAHRGLPIGWCQWYRYRDYADHAAAIGALPDDIGVDYAIGEPAYVGRGFGTALLAALVAAVRKEYPRSGLVADPEAANVASRRVLEKNGFELMREARVATEPTDALMAIYRLAPVLR
jgi:aminoglycoside 6'-N-acetyltransferase